MRMMTLKGKINFAHSGSPFNARKNLLPWFDYPERVTTTSRVAFGHWSSLGLVVLPNLLSLDSGCVWGRQLTAVRLDKQVPRLYQVPGEVIY
jgi:bis(5'-nucleosyl)-tetraphosphatase (symmetrical)